MLRIGVLASGGGTNLQAILDAIDRKELDAEVVLVVSGRKSAYALERARSRGIDAVFVSGVACASPEEYGEKLIQLFEEKQAGLIVLAGFMTVLSENFIRHFRNRIINIHCSLIPAFCGKGFYGLRVHEAALERGVKITGATVHFVTEECDGGPIILQKAVAVREGDTPETLQLRVMEEAERVILPEAIRMISEGRLAFGADGELRIENGERGNRDGH